MRTYYYIARQPPKGVEVMHVTVREGTQWDVKFIMKMLPDEDELITTWIIPCALYTHNLSPTKVYLHLIDWATYDLMDAFEIRHVRPDNFKQNYRLDDPQFTNMEQAQRVMGV